jgi:hypothetical protein
MDAVCILQRACCQLWYGQAPQSESRRGHGICSLVHRRLFAVLLLIYIAAAAQQKGVDWKSQQQAAASRARMVRRIEHILDEKFRAFYKKEPVARKIKETAVQLEQELFSGATSKAMYEEGTTLRLRVAALLRQKVERDEHAKQQERKAMSAKKYSLFDQRFDEDWLAASLYNPENKQDSATKHDLLMLAGIVITVYAVAVGALKFHSLLRFSRSAIASAPVALMQGWIGITSTTARQKPDKAAGHTHSKQSGHQGVSIVQSSSSITHSRTKGPTKRQGSSSGSRRSAAGSMLPALKQDSSVGRPTLAGITGTGGHPTQSLVQTGLKEQQQQQQQQRGLSPKPEAEQQEHASYAQQLVQHRDRGSTPSSQTSLVSSPPSSPAPFTAQHPDGICCTEASRQDSGPASAGLQPASAEDVDASLPDAADASASAGAAATAAAAAPIGTGCAGVDAADECILCLEAPRQSILAPCGHCALCSDCTVKLYGPPDDVRPDASCPICCQRVCSYVRKVYLA